MLLQSYDNSVKFHILSLILCHFVPKPWSVRQDRGAHEDFMECSVQYGEFMRQIVRGDCIPVCVLIIPLSVIRVYRQLQGIHTFSIYIQTNLVSATTRSIPFPLTFFERVLSPGLPVHVLNLLVCVRGSTCPRVESPCLWIIRLRLVMCLQFNNKPLDATDLYHGRLFLVCKGSPQWLHYRLQLENWSYGKALAVVLH